MRKVLHALIILIMATAMVNGQSPEQKNYKDYPHWIEMMQEPGAKFADVQNAFNQYWEGREITKGCGWKPFKRWEYHWSSRLTKDGRIPQAGSNWEAYEKSSLSRMLDLGNWQNLGPFYPPEAGSYPNGTGRINAVGFHPTDADIVYVGAPAGGLWVTTDGGDNWTTNTDDLPTLGVSAIVVDYDDPDVIYLGTGDRDAGDSQGVGVLKSTDGGQTWNQFNTGMGNAIVGRLIMHPTDNQELLAATSSGIYKTTDGGSNWNQVTTGNHKDIVYHPTNSDIVYAAKGGNFKRSTDGGDSWQEGATGFPGASRITVGVSEDEPDYIYIFACNSQDFKGLYRSTDAGVNFETRSTSPNVMEWSCYGNASGGQAWYDMDIAVDPDNADVIFVGGVNIWKSVDGGANWNITAHWTGDCGVAAVHADHHVFEYSPVDGKLYNGNDGGIYWTDDQGQTFTDVTNGIASSQVYKMGQSATVKDYVINGYQDNGTSVFNPSNDWESVLGGDGMDCLIDYTDESYAYGEVYYGSISRVKDNYNQGNITNGISEEGAWVTPFTLHQTDPNTMFVGMTNVWRSNNVKASSTWSVDWDKISELGGGKLRVVENSPANPDVLYASKDNNMYRTLNANDEAPDWANISSNIPGSSTINDIEAHPYESNVLYVVSGTKVYMSEDNGDNFENITDNLPSTNMNTIEYYKRSYGAVYVGTDLGVYYRDASMDEWINYSEGLPLTSTMTDLEFFYDPTNPEDDRVRASTYGRGLWDSPVYFGDAVANFSSDITEVMAGCPVQYFDQSIGGAVSRTWTFEGGNPASSTEQNPFVTYDQQGTFAVTLEIDGVNGSDTKTVSAYITVVPGSAPDVAFSASKRVLCGSDNTSSLFDQSVNCPTSWHWSFEPDAVEFTQGTDANSQNPVVKFLDDASYDVTLVAGNGNGESSVTYEDYIVTSGFKLPFAEDFSNGFDYNDWEIINNDSKGTWEMADVGGNKAALMSFFNYSAPPGGRDELITPAFDFSDNESVFMRFRHAYATRVNNWSDSLVIFVSTNCGSSWQRVASYFEDGEFSFATHDVTTDEFIPEPNEWCGNGMAECNVVNLSQYAGMNNIKVKFETYNKNGNNLFIDDVWLSESIDVQTASQQTKTHMVVYPNPNDGHFNIVVNGIQSDVQAQIVNIHGQIVWQKSISAKQNEYFEEIDLNQLPTGIYMVNLYSGNQVINKKIVIE